MEFTTFKIYPDYPKKYKNWYYKVYLFSRKSSMYKVRDELEKDGANKMRKPHKYEALCSAYNSKLDKNQWGVVMFYMDSATKVGTVSHEMTHAANYWWKYLIKGRQRNIFKLGDEKFAWIQGNLVSQYWRIWYKKVKKA